MRNSWVLVSALVFGVGCRDLTKDVEKLADRVCACKDKACADPLVEEFLRFIKEHKNDRGDEERARAAGKRFGECAVNAGVDAKAFVDRIQAIMDH
jgi:hypothetical protein